MIVTLAVKRIVSRAERIIVDAARHFDVEKKFLSFD